MSALNVPTRRRSPEPGRSRGRTERSYRPGVEALEGLMLMAGGVAQALAVSASVPATVTNFTKGLTLPRFDPSQGLLTSVDLTLSGEVDTTETVTGNFANASGSLSGALSAAGPGGYAPALSMPPTAIAFDAGGVGHGSTTAADTRTITDPAALAGFRGPGTLTVAVTASAQAGADNLGGGSSFAAQTTGQATLNITYHYQALSKPVVTPPGPVSVTPGATARFTVSAAPGYDGQAITFALAPGAPKGATIDPKTGAFTWAVPANTAPGTYAVRVVAADASDPAVNAAATVSVVVNNPAPTVRVQSAGATVRQYGLYQLAGTFGAGSGVRNASVSYGDGTAPVPLVVKPDGSFALRHAYNKAGRFSVTVSFTGGSGGRGSSNLTVTVTPSAPLASGFGAGRDAFVISLYLDQLGRDPSPAELKAGAWLLTRGTNPALLAFALASSPEHKALVAQGLIPSVPLLTSFARALAAGRSASPPYVPA